MNFYEFVCICLLYVQVVAASHRTDDCSSAFTRTHVKIPSKRQALTLTDFNRHVVGRNMAVLYSASTAQADTPTTADWTVNLQFTAEVNGAYTVLATTSYYDATVLPPIAVCSETEYGLQGNVDCDKAVFDAQSPHSSIIEREFSGVLRPDTWSIGTRILEH